MAGWFFSVSRETLKRWKVRILLRLVLFMFFLPLSVLVVLAARGIGIEGDTVGFMLVFFLIVFAVAIPIGIISSNSMIRRFKETRLFIDTLRIVKTNGKISEEVYFNTVRNLKTIKDRSGRVLKIRIKTDNSAMTIVWLDQMDKILELINFYIPSEEPGIRTDRYSEDWNKTSRQLPLIVLGILAGASIFMFLTDTAQIGLVLSILSFILAMFFLLYGPMARMAAHMHKYDLAIFFVLILIALLCLFVPYIS